MFSHTGRTEPGHHSLSDPNPLWLPAADRHTGQVSRSLWTLYAGEPRIVVARIEGGTSPGPRPTGQDPAARGLRGLYGPPEATVELRLGPFGNQPRSAARASEIRPRSSSMDAGSTKRTVTGPFLSCQRTSSRARAARIRLTRRGDASKPTVRGLQHARRMAAAPLSLRKPAVRRRGSSVARRPTGGLPKVAWNPTRLRRPPTSLRRAQRAEPGSNPEVARAGHGHLAAEVGAGSASGRYGGGHSQRRKTVRSLRSDIDNPPP